MIPAEKVRELLARHGTTASQKASDWSGPFPLPRPVQEFYESVGPVDIGVEGYGNPYFLPRLADLWEYQAGYRYDPDTGAPLEGWDDDWLVVADEGADPFLLSRSRETILFAHHGEGEWEPDELFPDLNTMAACLATLGLVVSEAGSDFTDSDFNVRLEHRRRATTLLADLLGSRSEAESLLDWAGWG